MPVWFALYNTLRNSFEIYREPFISPIWGGPDVQGPVVHSAARVGRDDAFSPNGCSRK